MGSAAEVQRTAEPTAFTPFEQRVGVLLKAHRAMPATVIRQPASEPYLNDRLISIDCSYAAPAALHQNNHEDVAHGRRPVR